MSIMYGNNFKRGILSNLVGALIYIELKVLTYLTVNEITIMIKFLENKSGKSSM